MTSKVDLHHVVVFEDGLVADIGSPMRGAVVETGARGECDAGFEPVCLDKSPVCFFHLVADIHDFFTGTNDTLTVFAHLSVALGGSSEDIQIIEC